jgi:hypothetical protein
MSTCWHGKEGFCEICELICGDEHLKAVQNSYGIKEKEKKKAKDN